MVMGIVSTIMGWEESHWVMRTNDTIPGSTAKIEIKWVNTKTWLSTSRCTYGQFKHECVIFIIKMMSPPCIAWHHTNTQVSTSLWFKTTLLWLYPYIFTSVIHTTLQRKVLAYSLLYNWSMMTWLTKYIVYQFHHGNSLSQRVALHFIRIISLYKSQNLVQKTQAMDHCLMRIRLKN